MAKEFSRTRRVGEQMQRELSELIQRELKDPRVGMITITGVEVSRDMSHAKVFVTVLGGGEHSVEESLATLGHAAGFLRHELGQRMKLRIIPELHFFYDASIERGAHLSALIDKAVGKRGGNQGDN